MSPFTRSRVRSWLAWFMLWLMPPSSPVIKARRLLFVMPVTAIRV
jgi:hypothetical protein